jgi:GTP-binding protein Era
MSEQELSEQGSANANGSTKDPTVEESEGAGANGTPAGHRSGYVAVVGKPNVGKSTLVNALVGHKVAITSPKPQTTRRRIMGILTREDAQIIFVDTPGIHEPKHALNKYMMREVENALGNCDAILFVVDVSQPPDDSDRRVAERINKMPQPKVMALHKADLLDPLNVVEHSRQYHELFGSENSMLTSGVEIRVENLNELLDMLVAALPEGPEFYPPEQYTDQPEKVLAAELIREQALHFLEQEVPHAVAVSVDEYALRPNNTTYISATIFVERDSQKGILIGRGGQMLKRIGVEARREIERMVDGKVYLELWVKVREAWRRDEGAVDELLGSNV